ncbi:MAG: EamA family transporter [Myxococcota bacterium]
MSTEAICIALVAVFWGGYPLVARLSNFGGPAGSLVLATVALVPVVAATLLTGDSLRPTRAQLWPLLISGLMQGIGLLAFVRVATGRVEASVAIPLSDVGMMLVTTVGAIFFFQEAITAQKLAGLALLVAGIALLRPA